MGRTPSGPTAQETVGPTGRPDRRAWGTPAAEPGQRSLTASLLNPRAVPTVSGHSKFMQRSLAVNRRRVDVASLDQPDRASLLVADLQKKLGRADPLSKCSAVMTAPRTRTERRSRET